MAMFNIKLTGVVAGAGAALLGAILLPALGKALNSTKLSRFWMDTNQDNFKTADSQ